jgi:hypothetical protein
VELLGDGDERADVAQLWIHSRSASKQTIVTVRHLGRVLFQTG